MGSARGRPRRRKNPLGGLPSFGKAGARSAKRYSYPFRSPDSKSLFKYKSCPQDGRPLTQDNASPTRLVQVSHEDAFSLRHPQEKSSATFGEPLQLLQLRPTAWWIRSPVSFQSSRLSAPEMPHMPKSAGSCRLTSFLRLSTPRKAPRKIAKVPFKAAINSMHVHEAPISSGL